MATKSYKLRLDFRDEQPIVDERFNTRREELATVQRWLDDTRDAFNQGVDYLTVWLLRMHRGAGIWREKTDGIWRDWHCISTPDDLQKARARHASDPACFALLENHHLLDAFKGKKKSEPEAIELAECCRQLILHPTLLGAEREEASMSRGALDELTPSRSSKRGKRPDTKRGRWAKWQYDQAMCEEALNAQSAVELIARLQQRPEFAGRKKDARKRIDQIERRDQAGSWSDTKAWIAETCGKWKDAKEKAAAQREDWDALLRPLRQAGVLPLVERPTAHVGIAGKVSVWNYSMWDMAGQRVRSHLGWVRRRTKERVLWELRKELFERGGWLRTKRNGKSASGKQLEKAVSDGELRPDDLIRFDAPSTDQAGDFEVRPAYAGREWAKILRQYETGEMPRHLEAVAFGPTESPRILRRTAKGWRNVRDKWLQLLAKASKTGKSAPSARDLLEEFDRMRTRRTRDFGDRRLFEWLAAPARRLLWDGSNKGDDNDCGRDDRDCASAFIAHNELLADKPESVTFTRTEAAKHPVWPFFGENSAVEYRMAREHLSNGRTRLVLKLKQLLSRREGGSYFAVNNVKIALRGYEDFETSFAFPDGLDEVSPKQPVLFRDDLLAGGTRLGTLSGIKLIWERDELAAHRRKRRPRHAVPRIFASFSCDAGDAELPGWLTKHVGSNVKLKKPRDGMTRVFWLKKSIRKDSPDEVSAAALQPGVRIWPEEAVENELMVRGADLGYRTSSAGAWWRLSTEGPSTSADWLQPGLKLSFRTPSGKVAWIVGKCRDKNVYAVRERVASVSLPGDGDPLPQNEQDLRDRVRAARAGLSLNNAILRMVRLLTLNAITTRTKADDRTRKRSDGTAKRVGTRWKQVSHKLEDGEIKDNCRKVADQLLRWAGTAAMTESLKAINFDAPVWDWLAARDARLKEVKESVPTTEVPTEKQAKRDGNDRDAVKAQREKEDNAFAEAIFKHRLPLARALCDDYDVEKRRRARAGLWSEFDRALMRKISYSDRGDAKEGCEMLENGMFRVLRRPPATIHKDRKVGSNKLPHGKSHRGGLSMNRLNFLDDVKNIVRRWSCRSRWPGDMRRVPEDGKFDRCDTEHLDNLREHRAKLLAHADIAQSLGFEQDMRRGLWLYKASESRDEAIWHRPERRHLYQWRGENLVETAQDAPPHPIKAHLSAHINVYEDLSRYRMSSDRPRTENAGLARWSHRRILSFAEHVGGLFGVPVATVDARFSSRYCSRCGAPGCRADRFVEDWLKHRWLQRVREDTEDHSVASRNLRKAAMEVEKLLEGDPQALAKEPYWVLRDGGEYFVCANRNCDVHTRPMNADHNAAAGIGLRFLRGVDGIRVTTNSNGTVTKSIGYVSPNLRLHESESGKEPFWSAVSSDEKTSRKRGQSTPSSAGATEDDDDAGGGNTLFRDPSGTFRSSERWFEGKVFWGAVARYCAAGLNAANASRFGTESEDSEESDS